MKAIEIDDAIRRDPGLFSAVERATKRLEEEIGPSAESVSVEWKLFVADQILPTIVQDRRWSGEKLLESIDSSSVDGDSRFRISLDQIKTIENCD